MTFEEYLSGKKIDSAAFKAAEKDLWETWKTDFEQMHPNSFTAQKLYLINPIRRKYALKTTAPVNVQKEEPVETPVPAAAKPKINKPVFKPKPKIN